MNQEEYEKAVERRQEIRKIFNSKDENGVNYGIRGQRGDLPDMNEFRKLIKEHRELGNKIKKYEKEHPEVKSTSAKVKPKKVNNAKDKDGNEKSSNFDELSDEEMFEEYSRVLQEYGDDIDKMNEFYEKYANNIFNNKKINLQKNAKDNSKENIENEEPEIVLESYIGVGMLTLEEQFEKATGEKFDPDKYDVEYTGAEGEEYGDESVTPFKIIRKREKGEVKREKDNSIDNKEQKDSVQAIEDKHKAQLRIEQKDSKPAIEDKHKAQLRIEQKDPVPPQIEDKGMVVHPEVSIEKTGLEIFREQFNKMPYLSGRHALSENPFVKLPAALAPGIAGLAITGGIAALPVAIGAAVTGGVYLAAKPVLRAITGQAKAERQIREQFENMDEQEFLKMVEYMNEHKILSLKPHCAILNALTVASKSKLGNIIRQNMENSAALKEEAAVLSEKKDNNTISKDELKRYNEIGNLLLQNEAENERLENFSKNIERGTLRKSAEYKGNMKGHEFLNIFARRNQNSKVYGKVLNQYADAERAAAEEEAFSKYEKALGNEERAEERQAQAYDYRELQRKIMDKNTYSRLGVHRSVFNGNKDGSTFHIISDRADNTIKHIGMLFTAGVAAARIVTNMNKLYEAMEHNASEQNRVMNEYNKNTNNLDAVRKNIDSYDVSNSEYTQVQNSEIASQATAKEVEAMRKTGTIDYRDATYSQLDNDLNNDALNNFNAYQSQNVGSLSASDKLRKIAENITKTGQYQDDLSKISQDIQTQSGVDHSVQSTTLADSLTGKKIEADILNKFADTIDMIKKINPINKITSSIKHVDKDYLGPALGIFAPILGIGKDIKDNRQKYRNERRMREAANQERD